MLTKTFGEGGEKRSELITSVRILAGLPPQMDQPRQGLKFAEPESSSSL